MIWARSAGQISAIKTNKKLKENLWSSGCDLKFKSSCIMLKDKDPDGHKSCSEWLE